MLLSGIKEKSLEIHLDVKIVRHCSLTKACLLKTSKNPSATFCKKTPLPGNLIPIKKMFRLPWGCTTEWKEERKGGARYLLNAEISDTRLRAFETQPIDLREYIKKPERSKITPAL